LRKISKSGQGQHSVYSVDVIFQRIGMVEYIPCNSAPAVHWDLLPVTRLASRIILIAQNIIKWTGTALCVLCGCDIPVDRYGGVHPLLLSTICTLGRPRLSLG
jgi:hypothetical protein